MCGIAGIVSLDGNPVSEQEVRTMCGAIVHRGPDDEGFYSDPHAALGMRRLSIIDVVAGRQPISNEDRSVWVVFNGEIYNFGELRSDLRSRGHVFSTRADTEVIVHLYEQYGNDCVKHLRGMFSFALWDSRRRRLLLARDRLGIKPLYYVQCGGRIAFASELKSLLELREVGRTLNWRSVSHLFTFLTTPSGESIINGVHKLEPAHILTASAGQAPVVERYWDVKFRPDRGKPEGYFIERTRELLAESVRLHMVSDVPVGAFLSGGIDSSAVATTASQLSAAPLKTFSVGFAEHDFNELPHAGLVASEIGAEHHELTLGPDALDVVNTLAWHLDEPFGDSSAIPTFMVSRLAARHVKVVLSGDGGDELFAGYDKYLVEQRERTAGEWPGFARKIAGTIGRALPAGMRGRNYLQHRSHNCTERYLDSCTLFRPHDLTALFRPEFTELLANQDPWNFSRAYLNSSHGHWLSALQGLDLKQYLPLDILTKVDRMSMANSLETRVPLLDHKLVEFAATIPPEMNLKGGTTKYIFKQAMRGILPDGIIDRPKRGFAVPLAYWFRGGLGNYVRDLLLNGRARQRGFFDSRSIERLIRRHERGENLDLHLWTLISFEAWAQQFLDRDAGTATPKPQSRNTFAMNGAA